LEWWRTAANATTNSSSQSLSVGPYTLGIQTSHSPFLPASAPFTRTKIITIAPRFAVVNRLPFSLAVRQGLSSDSEVFDIASGSKAVIMIR
jgi:hypothetical protein